MRHWTIRSRLLPVLLLVVPATVSAARPKAPPPVQSAADKQYQAAVRAFEAGDHPQAKILFDSALAALKPGDPLEARILYNLAFLADTADQACDAQRAYERYLAKAPPGDAEHTRTRALAESRRDALYEVCHAPPPTESAPVADEPETAPEPSPRAPWILPVVAGSAVVGLGIGAGFQLWAGDAADARDQAFGRYHRAPDAETAARAQHETNARQGEVESRVIVGYAGLGVGAVLAGVAVYLWATDETPTVAVTPAPGGVVLGGVF